MEQKEVKVLGPKPARTMHSDLLLILQFVWLRLTHPGYFVFMHTAGRSVRGLSQQHYRSNRKKTSDRMEDDEQRGEDLLEGAFTVHIAGHLRLSFSDHRFFRGPNGGDKMTRARQAKPKDKRKQERRETRSKPYTGVVEICMPILRTAPFLGPHI